VRFLDGGRLLLVDREVWSLESSSRIATLDIPEDAVPDVSSSSDVIGVPAPGSRGLTLISARTGAIVRQIEARGEVSTVNDVVLSPRGDLVALAEEHALEVRETRDGSLVSVIPVQEPAWQGWIHSVFSRRRGAIGVVAQGISEHDVTTAVYPIGSTTIACAFSGSLCCFTDRGDLLARQEIGNRLHFVLCSPRDGRVLRDVGRSSGAEAISEDGTVAAEDDYRQPSDLIDPHSPGPEPQKTVTVVVRSLETRTVKRRREFPMSADGVPECPVRYALSATGDRLAVATADRIEIWEIPP
jgi:hypothetical protein